MPLSLSDLELFLGIAQQPSLAAASATLHRTPSALSKALRRLEADLGRSLFDRDGKSLRLNPAGEILRQRALHLLQQAEQTRSELCGASSAVNCRVAGPPLLLRRDGAEFARRLLRRYPKATLTLAPMYEDQAIAALDRGDADFAWVSGAVVENRGVLWRAHWQARAMGDMSMQLAAGPAHVLVRNRPRRRVELDDVLRCDFVCPPRSLLCGMARGEHGDGWRNDVLPRRIAYWTDDLQSLLALVRSGLALAYLPSFLLDSEDLVRIEISDCPYQCKESVFHVWSPTLAHGWQRQIA